MLLQSAGLGLEELIGGICRYFGIDEKELTGPTRRTAIAQVRGLIGHMATRELSIPGSVVARRFKQNRSAVSRSARRVDHDPELIKAATTIMEQLKCKVKQR